MYHRRSPCLRHFDYRQPGAYFVTICAHRQQCLFGTVKDGEVSLNRLGKIAAEEWRRTEELRALVELDFFIVMPNHIHGIIWIGHCEDQRGQEARQPAGSAGSLSAIVGQYKSVVTKRIRRLHRRPDLQIWQRSFHDHIIRNRSDLERIREYVIANPARWRDDSFYIDEVSLDWL